MKDCSARVSPPRVPGLISWYVLVFFAFLDSLHLDSVSASSTVCYTIEFGQLGEIAAVIILLWWCYKGRFTVSTSFRNLADTNTVLLQSFDWGLSGFLRSWGFLAHGLVYQMLRFLPLISNRNVHLHRCYLRTPRLTMHRCLFWRSEGTIFQSASLRIYTPRGWKNASTTCTIGYFWTRAISLILPRK